MADDERTTMAQRAPAPGGRPNVVAARLTNHEIAWVHAHKRAGQSPGQFLVSLLHDRQAQVAADEHQAELGETD